MNHEQTIVKIGVTIPDDTHKKASMLSIAYNLNRAEIYALALAFAVLHPEFQKVLDEYNKPDAKVG